MKRRWTQPRRPVLHAEDSLVSAILDGTFSSGTFLPAERELAVLLGVTRPTLREAIRSLERDGWITVRQGKRTTVNDYWREGGLNLLDSLVRHSDSLTPSFVTNLLEVRRDLAPGYFRAAALHSPETLRELLAGRTDLPETPQALAHFDWELHHGASVASKNPIYTLILNGFTTWYERLAEAYFAVGENRDRSMQFYNDLEGALKDLDEVERISLEMMTESIDRWESAILTSPSEIWAQVTGEQ